MITKIKLTNFQKHKSLEAEFTPGLNVIVGPSDAGKSAIFRALDFALNNGAKKSNVVSYGEKTASVELTINNRAIKREKGKSKNIYEVDDQLLKAFGANVPDEVANVTNLSEINFQSQHDKSFLLSATPGEVARYLNKLINLDVIDKLLSSLNSKQQASSRLLTVREGDYKELKKEAEAIEEIVQLLFSRHEELLSMDKVVSDEKKELDNLKTCVENYEEANKEDFSCFDKLNNSIEELKKLSAQLSCFLKHSDELEDCIDLFPEDVCDIDEVRFEDIKTTALQCSEWVFQNISLKSLIDEINGIDVEKAEADYNEAFEELKQLTDICPTCGKGW